MTTNILALDQSSHTTGYAIFQDGAPVVISHYDAPGKDLGERLVALKNFINQLIAEYNITELIFEDIQLQDINGSKQAGIKTFKILGEVLGVIHELAESNPQITHYEMVPPVVWKATFKIAGKGRKREKQLAQEYVKTTYNLACTEDESDACCIGAHYLKKKDSEYDWS